MNFKDIFVIDFNSKHISFCWAKCNGSGITKVQKLVQKSYAGFVDGDFLEKEQIGSILRTGVAELNIKSSRIKNLYIGVPAHFSNVVCKSVTKNFAEPKIITERDIYSLFDNAENFEHEGQTVINRSGMSFTVNEKTVENPIGMEASSINAVVSVIVADNQFIKTVSTNLPVVAISTPQFVSNQLCQALYSLNNSQRQNNAIIIDLGYINSSVSYIAKEGLLGLRSFSMGGGHIIGDLSQVNKISFDNASNLCTKLSLNSKHAKFDVVYADNNETPLSIQTSQEVVSARLDEIIKLISRCISSMNAQVPSYQPLYLTGECVELIEGIKNYFSKQLNRNVEVLSQNVPKYGSCEFNSVLSVVAMANAEEKYQQKTLWQKVFGFWLNLLYNNL